MRLLRQYKLLGRFNFDLVRQHYEENVVTYLAAVCVTHIDYAPVFFPAGALMLRCIQVMGADVFDMNITHAGPPWVTRVAPQEAALAALASPLFQGFVPAYDQDHNWPYEVGQRAGREGGREGLT